jgi:A/G-specific adenine glycosylase
VFRITENVDQSGTKNHLWELAEALLPRTSIREHNEALMELGALVCRPKHPDCPACPLRKLCEAQKHSVQDELPIRSPRKPIPHLDVTAGIIRKGKRFLITLRPPKGLLGGLWEFPGGKLEPSETLEACLAREIREELGIEIDVLQPLVSVDHAYTHFRITLHVFECRYRSGRIKLNGCDDYRWITEGELDDYAFPGADRKVIDRLQMK